MGVLAPSSLQASACPSCPPSACQPPLSHCLLGQPLVPSSGRQLPGPKLKPLAAQSQSLGSHGGFNFSKCKNQPFIKLKPSVAGYKAALLPSPCVEPTAFLGLQALEPCGPVKTNTHLMPTGSGSMRPRPQGPGYLEYAVQMQPTPCQ